MRNPTAALIALLALLAPLGAQESRRPVVALVPKGATHVFWKSVEAGAREAGTELGVEILWAAPQKEDDRAQQMGRYTGWLEFDGRRLAVDGWTGTTAGVTIQRTALQSESDNVEMPADDQMLPYYSVQQTFDFRITEATS